MTFEQEPNPYAPPTAVGVKTNLNTDAVAIRQAHISHEASIKSFGLLYYLGAVIMIIAAIGMLVMGTTFTPQPSDPGPWFFFIFAFIYLVMGGLQFWVASGLRALNQVGKIGGSIYGVLGLLGFPIGTLISAYLLYLLWSRKGQVVFSDDYKKVIEATPEIKYKTSLIVWVLLIILVIVFVLAIGGAFISGV